MKYNIITISREFASGGRSIGKAVAEKLGIPCYDTEDIVALIPPEIRAQCEEDERRGRGYHSRVYTWKTRGFETYDYWFDATKDVILQLAQQGPCVFIGRGADYILKDRQDCLRVFIYADDAYRLKRIRKYEFKHENDLTPEERMKKKDSKRERYYKVFTNEKWGQAKNYQLCLNSGVLHTQRCIDLLVDIYNNAY